jgi:hypothetical protein
MEILSFIVGAGMVVGILAVVFAVRFYKEFQTLKGQYQYHLEDYTNTRRDMWEQIDRNARDASSSIDIVYNTFHPRFDEVYRQMDSRFDKFENKISKKQVLND